MKKISITLNYLENCNALQLITITHYHISGPVVNSFHYLNLRA